MSEFILAQVYEGINLACIEVTVLYVVAICFVVSTSVQETM